MIKKNIRQYGQSLWEVIIALAIASLIAVGLVRITSSVIKGTRYSSDQNQVTALAQKTMAEIIDQKNQNPQSFWEVFSPPSGEMVGIYCLRKETKDVSTLLPTGRMAQVLIDVFWDQKGSLSDCGSVSVGKANYQHFLHFDTYVTD